MDTPIDLDSEVVVNLSTVRDPYVRLMLSAIGQAVAAGSPWVAVNRDVAALCCVSLEPATVRVRSRSAGQRGGAGSSRSGSDWGCAEMIAR